MTTTTLKIRGMRCGSCVNHVQKSLTAIRGVKQASVNLATEEATVTHDPAQANVPALIQAVEQAGYEALPEGDGGEKDEEDIGSSPAATESPPSQSRADEERKSRQEMRGEAIRLIVGAVLTIPVVVLGMFFHDAMWAAWPQLLLATPIQIYLGWPFFKGAFKSARHLRADMDTLVALGTSVAFIYSAVVTLEGGHRVYFDTAVVILVLISVGKLLEHRARASAASAIRGLMEIQPTAATIIRGDQEVSVPIDAVRPGDIVLVRPGQKIPVDGAIIEGRSAIDQSMVTGESMPVEVGPGDDVIGGTLNQSGAFRFTATQTGEGMLLARVITLVKQAQASKAGVQRIADAIAGVFVPVVLLIAIATLLGWGLLGRGDDRWIAAMTNTVAVLIVACPCALGLATPTAIMVGTGLGAREGILIKDAAALERAGKLTHVVFDKTGTLTEGRPGVVDVVALPGANRGAKQIVALAAAVERGSEHPLGRAIVEYARQTNESIPNASDFQSTVGFGVEAVVDGQTVRVHRAEGALAKSPEVETQRRAGRTAVVVSIGDQPIGIIALTDEIKPSAQAAVAELHRLNLRVTMLTGDHAVTAQAVATKLGIDDVLAGALPTQKHEKIESLRQRGAVVAMVGDGINDAPALAAADIGMAMGSRILSASNKPLHNRAERLEKDKKSVALPSSFQADGQTESVLTEVHAPSDIALDAGHVVLVGGDPATVPRAILLSRATMRRIYAGLFWAFLYNVILIPIAVAGWLHPMLAAGAMALSSVSVVINALWLRWRWRPRDSST